MKISRVYNQVVPDNLEEEKKEVWRETNCRKIRNKGRRKEGTHEKEGRKQGSNKGSKLEGQVGKEKGKEA